MFSEVITEDRIDERGHLVRRGSKKERGHYHFRKNQRGRLIFPKTVKEDKRKRTSRRRNVRI